MTETLDALRHELDALRHQLNSPRLTLPQARAAYRKMGAVLGAIAELEKTEHAEHAQPAACAPVARNQECYEKKDPRLWPEVKASQAKSRNQNRQN